MGPCWSPLMCGVRPVPYTGCKGPWFSLRGDSRRLGSGCHHARSVGKGMESSEEPCTPCPHPSGAGGISGPALQQPASQFARSGSPPPWLLEPRAAPISVPACSPIACLSVTTWWHRGTSPSSHEATQVCGPWGGPFHATAKLPSAEVQAVLTSGVAYCPAASWRRVTS